MDIEVLVSEVTTLQTDVVTAANRSLAGGGGVDRAVHRVAGPDLPASASTARTLCGRGRPHHPAFDLNPPVRYVVHAVGPRYGVDEPAADLLASAHRASLARCDEVAAASVAFPSLSTGAHHYPLVEACRISVAALLQTPTRVERCTLVASDVKTERLWRRVLADQRSQ